MSAVAPITERFKALRDYAGALAWQPLVDTSRSLCIGLLGSIRIGRLEIEDINGKTFVCGTAATTNAPNVSLKVHNPVFWLRLALFADMGFAESYMLSDIDCSDLTSFFKLFIINRPYLSNGSTITSTIASSLSGFLRATNSLSNARLNIAAHYDISNDMFAAFLSPDMTYSCPIWLPASNPASPAETLEAAQNRKLARFIANTRIQPSDHVLEIGTGWGSFAIKAARDTGCRVTSLTLSVEQKELAEKRIRDAGLQDRIKVLLCDYRDASLPDDGKPYDKVVSIEMLEAVGREWLVTYFRQVDRLLKKDGGIACFQCITMPETRYDAYAKSDDFIRRYIFPGGHLPTVSQLIGAIDSGSSHRLITNSVDDVGPHYAKTLRLWRDRFVENFETAIRPALAAEWASGAKADDELGAGPEERMKEEMETFRRKWEYYFTYCEAGFATKTLGDVIITVAREGAEELMLDVPL